MGMISTTSIALTDGPAAWWSFESIVEDTVAASQNNPVCNLALVILGWGTAGASLAIDGEELVQGPKFRIGHQCALENADLTVWIRYEATDPFELTLATR
ncbi:MAG: hypothetical protein JXB62_01885 [Pirellulales bacterium]|nr:hypothetical protein [Pirellulales bacterium]